MPLRRWSLLGRGAIVSDGFAFDNTQAEITRVSMTDFEKHVDRLARLVRASGLSSAQ
jgi:hypothetical protein